MGKAISGKAIREMRERERKAHHLEKKIKVASRLTHLNYLIVCEGEKTEPNYFKALVKGRNSQVLTATIEGEGANTKSLIDIAIKRRALSPIHFDVTWAVFDKDDFVDFNEAIEYAKSNGVNPAWSNEAFELWYYLHFQYLDTQVGRHQYIEMLTREVRKVYPRFEYRKNDEGIYQLLTGWRQFKIVIMPDYRNRPMIQEIPKATIKKMANICQSHSVSVRCLVNSVIPICH